jgi:GTP 3',8-cyclase
MKLQKSGGIYRKWRATAVRFVESGNMKEKALFAPGNRKIDYLRISVTDRCNLRCVYCMPPEGVKPVSHGQILSYEEIFRFSRVAVQAGISKIRITGGEPLVRKGIARLIGYLSTIEGLSDISMTTNGILLPAMAGQLKEAGLRRINISLDSLDAEAYRRMTRGGELARAFEGIRTALETGFVKINVVVMRGINEDIERFIALAEDYPVHVRFIEYMPAQHGEMHRTVSFHEMIKRVGGSVKLQKALSPDGAGPARYYTFPGCQGSLGFISPMSRHFCSECNRLRLTSIGTLIPCLFSEREIPLREFLGGSDEEILQAIKESLSKKISDSRAALLKRSMSRTGG